jgi:ribosome-dependent ATPase
VSADEALKRLQSDDVSVVIEIPPHFGRDFRRGSGPEVLAQVDGAMTFRGDTVAQYVQGVHATDAVRSGDRPADGRPAKYTADIEERFMYNPTFESVYSMVPSVPRSCSADPGDPDDGQHRAREGARLDDQLLRHADGRLEYLLGKQLPYITIGVINFAS